MEPKGATMNDTPDGSSTTDRIAFEDRLAFQFDAEGLLTVTIASVQHVLMPEEVGQLRNWLLSGEEFTQDD
jgi:hypothetical protein